MMIVGVVTNPGERSENVISLQEAVTSGLIDLGQGLYYNQKTKETVPMMRAISSGWVKVQAIAIVCHCLSYSVPSSIGCTAT